MERFKKIILSTITAIMLVSVTISAGDSTIGRLSYVYADTTVYVTRTGSKYHSHKCGNGTYYKSTLSAAVARGLEPCKKCYGGNPPSVNSSSGTGNKKKQVKLNATSKVLVVRQSATLKVKGSKSKVKWQSSNKKIVKVSKKGKITAVRKGKAVIKAGVSGKTCKCKVTVEEPVLSQTEVTMYEGENITLFLKGCKHEPEWESDDEDIADVFDGEIYAEEPGITVVRAWVHGKAYRCTVTVMERVHDGDF